MPALPQSFWLDQQKKLFDLLLPIFIKATMKGTVSGEGLLIKIVGQELVSLNVNYDLVEQISSQWANKHTTQVVKKISQTSMTAFLNAYSDWSMSGKPLSVLIDELEPFYGLPRAKMVAVTETTRAFENGKLVFWKHSGLVPKKRWNSVQDKNVSDICTELDGQVVPIDQPFATDSGDTFDSPPGHVGCRSFISPVI